MIKLNPHLNLMDLNDETKEYCLEICASPLSCDKCFKYIYAINRGVDEPIINSYQMPGYITRIKIELIPGSKTKDLYSFDGIEKIMDVLFTIDKDEISEELLRLQKTYLKIYFKSDEFYNIPVMCIEFLFIGRFKDYTLQHFQSVLYGDIVNLTGNNGEIEVFKVKDNMDLRAVLFKPLLKGQDDLTLKGIYLNKGFSEIQLKELNILMIKSLIKINLKDIINHPFKEIFAGIKSVIIDELNQAKEEEEEDEYINYILTGKKGDNRNDEEEDETLPF